VYAHLIYEMIPKASGKKRATTTEIKIRQMTYVLAVNQYINLIVINYKYFARNVYKTL